MLEITDKKNYPNKPEFLQSWNYGNFLIENNRKVKRILIGNTQIQYIINQLPLGKTFVYIPRAKIKQENIAELISYFKRRGHAFVRLELTNNLDIKNKTMPVKNRQPHHTWILDVTPDEDTLLKNMHSKTRYNIRLAERKGVKINTNKNINVFWHLNEITTKRNNYKSHPKKYIEKLLHQNTTYQINAYVNTTAIASAILLKHEDMLIYFFGASSNEHRNLMAPYLLHFEIIKLAKKLGCIYYDFWGIAPPRKKGSGNESCYHHYCWEADHALTGVARFKAGFDGELKSYPHAIEIPLKKMYYILFRLFKKLRGGDKIVGHPK